MLNLPSTKRQTLQSTTLHGARKQHGREISNQIKANSELGTLTVLENTNC